MRVTLCVAVACLIAGQALAQFPPITDPNRDEAKCQSGTATTLARLFATRMKCVRACIATGRKGGGFGGCFGPGFTDPATNTCIFNPLNGTEAKAKAGIIRACASDCPECYTAVDANLCATGQPFVTDGASQVDAFAQQIYCVEVGGAVPSKSDAKCEDAVAKSLVRFVGAKTRCYQTCATNMRRGSIAPGSCDPPLPADPATSACIAAAGFGSHGAVYAIDKVCERIFDPAKNTRPACYTMVTGTGEGWVPPVESYVDSRISISACGG